MERINLSSGSEQTGDVVLTVYVNLGTGHYTRLRARIGRDHRNTLVSWKVLDSRK